MKKNLLKGLMLFAALAFGLNLNAQSYCDYMITSSSPKHINDFVTTGAVTNVNNVGSGAGTTTPGYSDFTTTVLQAYETQVVGFSIATSNISTYGVSIFIDWNNDFTFDPSEKVYGSTGYIGMPMSNSFTVPAGTAMGQYRMRVIAAYLGGGTPGPCGQSDAEAEDYTIEIVSAPSCLAPQNINVSSLSSTSAEIGWTDISSATTWNVEYGIAGFVPGSGTIVNGVTSNPYTFTVTPVTEYEFYVQADCGGGDESAWAGPFFFTNDYCGVSTTSGEYLTVIETIGANSDISYTASTQPAGSYADSTALVIESFETQAFDLNTTYSSGSNGVNVWVDWNNNFSFDANELVTSLANSSASKAQSIVIPAGTPVGAYRMRVRGQWGSAANPPACGSVTYGSTVDFTLNIVAAPSCLPVLNIDTLSTTISSVELEWDENNGSTAWNIEYGPAGFTPGAGTIVAANSNPFTVTGLNASSNYDFYVQSVCSASDQSTWSGPFSVYTACGIAVAPFYEGFNNAVQPQCWENLSSNPSTSADNYWRFNKQGEHGALQNGKAIGTFATSDGSTPNPDSMMLITPEIDISQLTTPYLSFEWFSNNTQTPGNNVPLIIEVFDGTSWNLLDTLRGDSPNWEFVNYDLSAYSNNIIQVRFMTNQSGITSAFYNDILLDEIRIDDCVTLGGQDGSLDVCRFDNTVNLNDNIIVKPNGGGIWSFPSQPDYLTEDSIFNVTYLPAGSYEVYYVERTVCYDTTFATINVFNKSSAGTSGTLSVCKNEPINLFEALGGNVDLGGDWYDFSSNLLPNSQPKAQPIPGQYNYTYIASNGVCPADTAIVEVGVLANCDFLSLDNELFTDISVFPNPATSQLNITNPSNTSSLKVEMLDMNGRIVLVENKALNNASQATLAIDHLEKGIYTLRVYNNEGQKTFKVVKQ